jgi:diadenosine tetraphosphatase ApaH/serine/threonine PP2A family protein phosphatase
MSEWTTFRERLIAPETIEENQVIDIVMRLMNQLYQETNVLHLHSPIIICGDIHGQLDDLLQLFETAGGVDKDQAFLFLGDYVDRGYFSLNTFLYLASLKLQYPDRYFLLRGNHETRQVTQMYGFYTETIVTYGHSGIWALCNDVFDLLPVAAVIDKFIFAVHGGISRFFPIWQMISSVNRQEELPPAGGLADLCWSDPDDIRNFRPSTRGSGTAFGGDNVKDFLHRNKLSLVVRSHQLVQEGFQWKFGTTNGSSPKPPGLEGSLITVWSAPNYTYKAGNKASIMKFGYKDGPGYIELVVFDANLKRIDRRHNDTVGHYFV